MFFRITITLAFSQYDPLNDLLEEALRRLPQAFTVNPNTINEERGLILTEQCFHDQQPNEPCSLLEKHQTA